MINIHFTGTRLVVNGKSVEKDFPIKSAMEISGKIVVLYDPDSNIPKFGQFQNLIAIDREGTELWKAELPTSNTGDCYVKILSEAPLRALSFHSYQCQINVDSGKIQSKEFIK